MGSRVRRNLPRGYARMGRASLNAIPKNARLSMEKGCRVYSLGGQEVGGGNASFRGIHGIQKNKPLIFFD